MAKLEIKVEKNGADLKCSFNGAINEDVVFDQQLFVGIRSANIDMKNISAINSCGIREWVKWMSNAGNVPVQLHNCPKVIIDQINMVHGFLTASTKVISFYVPYFCEKTGVENNILYTYGKEFDEKGIRHPQIQDEAGNMMEMDIIEAKYFKFLRGG